MRFWTFARPVGLSVFALCSLSLFPLAAHGDAFDRYTNPVLAKVAEAKEAKEIKRLTADLITEHGNVLPDAAGALLMVRTNNGSYSKLLVQTARQRTAGGSVPIILVERFVSYRPSQDRAIQASGQDVHLYNGFLLNLDIGQIVPAEVGGDLRFVMEGADGYLEPVGKARLYLITKPIFGTESKKANKPAAGESFEPQHFDGAYQVHDDGRRTARLTLKVAADGQVSGKYVSDKSGQEYEVAGKVSSPPHRIQFTVKMPQTEHTFEGWMFTGDRRAICGSTQMGKHEFGFYALRVED